MLATVDNCSDSHPSALSKIYQEHTTMATWNRQLDASVAEYAQTLINKPHCFKTRFILPPERISDQLQKELPLNKQRQAFIDDITLVADMFACLFDLKNVGLRMEVLNTAMCPRFHVDKVPSRLITTYAGAGTQWLENKHVERNTDGSIQTTSNAQPYSLQIGDVALLKGESWIGNEGRGLVHRSPSADDASRRLVLTLDFA